MSTFAAVTAAGQSFAETQMGEAFSIGNTNYTGVVSFIERDLVLEAQGIRSQADAVIVAKRSQFSAAPTTRDTVVYSTANYSVRDVTDDAQAYTLTLKRLS